MKRRRQSLEVHAAQAQQVLDNPAFERAFEEHRKSVITKLERLELTGDNDSAAAALVHELQAAKNFKAELVRKIFAGDRAAERDERQEKPEPFDPTAVNPTIRRISHG